MAIALVIAMVTTIRKSNHSKSGHFCSDFKCYFQLQGEPLVNKKDLQALTLADLLETIQY